MPNWRKTIELKDLFTDEEDDESVRNAARQVVERLKREVEYPDDPNFEMLVAEFDEITRQSSGASMYGGRFTLCDWFNQVLNDLYDWADNERVWIG